MKGQFGGFFNLVIGVVFALILIIAVAVPVATQVIANQAFTGINSTVANLIPLFLLLGALGIAASFLIQRYR